MSKLELQAGDWVKFDSSIPTSVFHGSVGIFTGERPHGHYEVDWKEGPGVKFQIRVGRCARHNRRDLKFISTAPIVHEPDETIYDDLI